METQHVRVVVSLAIDEGKLEQFRSIAAQMNRGCKAERGTISYEWFISDDNKRCRTFEAFADSEAMLAHFTGTVVGLLVPKLLECTKVERLEVYGDISAEARAVVAGFGASCFPTLRS